MKGRSRRYHQSPAENAQKNPSHIFCGDNPGGYCCYQGLEVKRENKARANRAGRTPAAPNKEPEIRNRPGLKAWHRGVLLLTLAAVAVGCLVWLCARDPQIRFLSRDKRAEWILFPRAMDAGGRGVVSLDTVFRREFELTDPSRAARLDMRATKRAQIKINGTPVEIAASRNWKDVSSADVVSFLRPGRNSIEARVFNDNAPPVLWLALTADRFTLRTDATWEASCTDSAWRHAALATTPGHPGPGNPIAGGEKTWRALRAIWPIWLMFAGIAAVILFAGRKWLGRLFQPESGVGLSRRQTALLLVTIGSLWMLLFWNNARLMPFQAGFDAQAHLDYVRYIQEKHSLPLPNQGLQMFQPPLFYVISAGVLSVCGLSAATPSGILGLRFLTLLFGIAHFAIVFATLRLIWPAKIGRQLVGLVIAAFVPMNLYMSQYCTNETLAALLVSASIYQCLRILHTGRASFLSCALLGLTLGAAMLTKFTAILALPFIAAALARQFIATRTSTFDALMKLGAFCIVAAVVSAWHYVRIARAMGTLIIGGWDPATGFSWWQDDGYRTSAFFMRFGRSLADPLFSGAASFLDGIYATLWGDGLCGGVAILLFRVPWNYNLMCAGYLISALPTVLILIGAFAAAVQLIRRGGAERFLLLGLAFGVVCGLIYLNLSVPALASVKAFYGLSALLPLALFGAVGWDKLTRDRRLLQSVMGSLLLVWAMNSFASFWIVPSAAQHMDAGLRLGVMRQLDAATAEAEKAVSSDPSSAPARRFLASILSDSGRTSEALPHAQRAVELNPMDDACHVQLGMILVQQGQIEPALGEARRGLELGPENPSAYDLLIFCLSKLGRDDELIDVVRDGLAVTPFSVELHYALGGALARKAHFVTAANHFAYSLLLWPDFPQARSDFRVALRAIGKAPDGLKRLQELPLFAPDAPVILNEIAWFFATQPDAMVRNGPEAVRLAEHASALTGRKAPEMLVTLAAAYAENGKVPEAISIAEEARLRAQSSGDANTISVTEKLLAAFQAGHAYHEEPGEK